MEKEIISARAAAKIVKSSDAVIVGGSGGMGVAESVLCELEQRYLVDQNPRNLTLIHTTGIGAVTKFGLNLSSGSGVGLGQF